MTVLLLCDEGDDGEDSIQMLIDVTKEHLNKVQIFECLKGLYFPDSPLKHAVVNIPFQFLIDITDEIIKIDPCKIIDDYKKRQIPRFQ